MSTLIPTHVSSFTTPGEKLFYHFLQKTPRPDHECLAWYSPLVEGKEPDFVLYTPDVGLIVFGDAGQLNAFDHTLCWVHATFILTQGAYHIALTLDSRSFNITRPAYERPWR